MSLTTSKTRAHPALKKRQGTHHRHSKSYLKTYWPYLPVIGVIGLGLVINHDWHTTPSVNLTSYTYFDLLESSIGLFALAIFLLRHAFAWHKVLVYGEEFAAKHPALDICLVTVAVGGMLLAHHIT